MDNVNNLKKTGKALNPISVLDLTSKDSFYLRQACDTMYTGIEVRNILAELATGHLQMIRVTGVAEGIVLTQVLDHPAGREFRLFSLAGKGIITHAKTLMEEFKEMSQRIGCRWIGIQTDNPTLEKVMKVMKMKKTATLYLEDMS